MFLLCNFDAAPWEGPACLGSVAVLLGMAVSGESDWGCGRLLPVSKACTVLRGRGRILNEDYKTTTSEGDLETFQIGEVLTKMTAIGRPLFMEALHNKPTRNRRPENLLDFPGLAYDIAELLFGENEARNAGRRHRCSTQPNLNSQKLHATF